MRLYRVGLLFGGLALVACGEASSGSIDGSVLGVRVIPEPPDASLVRGSVAVTCRSFNSDWQPAVYDDDVGQFLHSVRDVPFGEPCRIEATLTDRDQVLQYYGAIPSIVIPEGPSYQVALIASWGTAPSPSPSPNPNPNPNPSPPPVPPAPTSPPTVRAVDFPTAPVAPSSTIDLVFEVEDDEGDRIDYFVQSDGGQITSPANGSVQIPAGGTERLTVTVTAPDVPGAFNVTVEVTDRSRLQDDASVRINATGGLGFRFDDAKLANGVIYFATFNTGTIRRYDVAADTFADPWTIEPGALVWAVAPDGSGMYAGYPSGRIVSVDMTDGATSVFSIAPARLWSMEVAGPFLFTVDDSGAWESQSVYDRATTARLSNEEWRHRSATMVYSPRYNRMYYLRDGTSPNDINYVEIDPETGALGAEVDSPYHGDFRFSHPLKLTADEGAVVSGSGLMFSTADLTYVGALGLTFVDLAHHGDKRYVLEDLEGGACQLITLAESLDIEASEVIEGRPFHLFAVGDQLVAITSNGITRRSLP